MEETKQKQTSEQLASFNKLVKDWAKTREAPYGIKSTILQSPSWSTTISLKQLLQIGVYPSGKNNDLV